MKFRLKMTLAILWLLALAYGVGGSLLITISFRGAMQRETEAAVTRYQMALQTLQMVYAANPSREASSAAEIMRQLEDKADWTAVRLTQNGQSLFTHGETFLALTASSDGICESIVFSNGSGHFLQAGGCFTANESQMELITVTEISSIYAQRTAQQHAYRRIFLALTAVSGLLAFGISTVLTRPLAEIARTSRKLAMDDLSARVRPRTQDEVGQLAAEFNRMAGKIEENVTQLQEAMERQERFMGSFAHELKTPMTSVIGYADLLRSEALPPEEAREAANYIYTEGRRLEALSLKLLELLVTGKQEIQLLPAEPAQVITAFVRRLRPIYAKSNIKLLVRCAPGRCLMEPDLIRSLLSNLIDNARKSMEAGGSIHVISDWVNGDCRIRVIDQGRGIPEEALRHITEAFYRVDKARSRTQGGAGLGLTLCKEIVALHHGTLSFESRPGAGTCVTVLLKGGNA